MLFYFILEKIILFLVNVIFILLCIAIFTLIERKVMSSVQRRKGPNITGLFGFLQPFADGLKLLLKEIIVPSNSTFRTNNYIKNNFYLNIMSKRCYSTNKITINKISTSNLELNYNFYTINNNIYNDDQHLLSLKDELKYHYTVLLKENKYELSNIYYWEEDIIYFELNDLYSFLYLIKKDTFFLYTNGVSYKCYIIIYFTDESFEHIINNKYNISLSFYVSFPDNIGNYFTHNNISIPDFISIKNKEIIAYYNTNNNLLIDAIKFLQSQHLI